jgi:23S rRNA (uracil1939-C5)-methyltransferase
MLSACHKTLKQGDEIELTIEAVAFGGAGIGRFGGMVVFVPFAIDGDSVFVRIESVRKRFATAVLKSVRVPSPYRTTPRCTAYTRCGACSYQHISYDYQLVIKNRQVRDALERIGRFSCIPLKDIIPSPQTYGYRGKADFHFSMKGGRCRTAGFAFRKTNHIVDLQRCELVHESINEAFSLLREDKSTVGRRPLWSAEGNVTPSRMIRRVKDRELLVPRNGFFQTNLSLTDTLVNVVEEFCDLSGNETVLDGYCGSGLFSLFLAPRCRQLFGIEVEDDAVLCAEENMIKHNIATAVFYTGSMAPILREKFISGNIPVDVAIVDPPRTGLNTDTVDALGVLNAPKIVYVSCNPATLARDLRALADFGYNIKRVQPLDMFPQTSHIETVALLELNPFPIRVDRQQKIP